MTRYADPVAQAEIDRLTGKVERVEAMADRLIAMGVVSIYESALEVGSFIRGALDDPEESDV